MKDEEAAKETNQARRSFIASSAAALTFAGLSFPIAGAWMNRPPASLVQDDAEQWFLLLPSEELTKAKFKRPNQIHSLEIKTPSLDGWRVRESKIRVFLRVEEKDSFSVFSVFSAECPHLGCGVNHIEEKDAPSHFHCPCHHATFDAKGASDKGPSPRGLDELPHRVSERGLEFQALRYRLNTSEKEVLA